MRGSADSRSDCFFAGAKLGPAIGAYRAALLIENYGWREMFIILGLGSLIWLGAVADDSQRMMIGKLETAAKKTSAATEVSFWSVFKTPAIYGIIIGTFAYNYFNYFCMTWLPAYFIEQLAVDQNRDGAVHRVQLQRDGSRRNPRRGGGGSPDRERLGCDQGAQGIHDCGSGCCVDRGHRRDERIARYSALRSRSSRWRVSVWPRRTTGR